MNAKRPSGNVSYDNSGRVVLVTGGAQGIGLAICRAFAASGAHVVCADILPSDSQAVSELSGHCHYQRTDTASEADCQAVVEWTVKTCGGLDVLVNNAAIQPPASYKPVHELDTELAARMVGVNLMGYTYMAKHALRTMHEQQSGVVVNIASGQGDRTARGVPIYGPIKAANILQAMQWAVEYARQGIRVVSVSPGAIETPLVQASLAAQGGAAALANRHPLGRIGQPNEIAAAVLWLASHDASFVTGTDLAVDGGLSAFGAFADPY